MDIIIKSLTAGIATAIILLLARFVGPKLAGAIGGLPIVFAISYILVTANNKGLAREFLIGGIYGAIAAILFSFILILLNAQFLKSYWLNFLAAYIVCFFVAFML